MSKELIQCLLGIQRSSDMNFFFLVLLSDAQKTLSLLKFLLAMVTEGNMEGSFLPSCLGSVDFTYFLHEVFELTLSHLVLPHWFHQLFKQCHSHTMLAGALGRGKLPIPKPFHLICWCPPCPPGAESLSILQHVTHTEEHHGISFKVPFWNLPSFSFLKSCCASVFFPCIQQSWHQ